MKNPPVYPTLESMPVARTADDVTYHDVTHTPGMSLLDHFAGLAMQGFCVNNIENEAMLRVAASEKLSLEQTIARASYVQARAMLEERAKPENQL